MLHKTNEIFALASEKWWNKKYYTGLGYLKFGFSENATKSSPYFWQERTCQKVDEDFI